MHVLRLALVIAAFAAGCGYKGPLYLPKPTSEGQKPGVLITPEPAPDRPVPAESAPAPK